MKPNLFKLLLFILIFVSLSGCNPSPFQSGQLELAKTLGVKISDYPDETIFPAGYYATILKSGMSMLEVHLQMKGYERVYHCKNYKEVYYYFSIDDQKAIRIALFYDSNRLFERMEEEDPNSRTLFITNCEIGLIND